MAPSTLYLNEGGFINDKGEIAGYADLPDGSPRAFLMTPNRH